MDFERHLQRRQRVVCVGSIFSSSSADDAVADAALLVDAADAEVLDGDGLRFQGHDVSSVRRNVWDARHFVVNLGYLRDEERKERF